MNPEQPVAPQPQPQFQPPQPPQPTPQFQPEPVSQPQMPVTPVQSFPQQPMMPPVQMPAPKSHKVRNIVLGILGVFILFGVIGGVLLSVGTKRASDNANKFATALTTQDYDTVYSQFSDALKAKQSEADLKIAFTNAPFTSACKLKITGIAVEAKTGSGTVKTIQGNIACPDKSYPTKLEYVTVNGVDKLNSYEVGAASN